MARTVLFHHAHGLTPGVVGFADRAAGNTVDTPDLYQGATFAWAEEDAETARSIAAASPAATVFEHPGSGHLFADPDSPDHDPTAAALLLERALEFLATIDGSSG